MIVRWISAFIDRPGSGFEATVDFWCRMGGSSLSAWRGEHNEFATLLPLDGADAHLRVQRTESQTSGSHLDLHVDDVGAAADECVAAGAEVRVDNGGFVVLASPGGMPFCVVPHHDEARRQGPVTTEDDKAGTLLDQVSIDADPDVFDDEVRFWSTLTGWPPVGSSSSEFAPLERPHTMPLRLMVQRRNAPSGPTSCHLDFACADQPSARSAHEEAGATMIAHDRPWIVMSDPSGVDYCLTPRDPVSGVRPV